MGTDDFKIERINVTLKTGNATDAATNGQVYLLIGGREFNIKRADIDDRAKNAKDKYQLGRNANIEHTQQNDPRKLLFGSPDLYPVGLRFEPEDQQDNWNLEWATVEVTAEEGSLRRYAILEEGNQNLWLGFQFGLVVYLGMVEEAD